MAKKEKIMMGEKRTRIVMIMKFIHNHDSFKAKHAEVIEFGAAQRSAAAAAAAAAAVASDIKSEPESLPAASSSALEETN